MSLKIKNILEQDSFTRQDVIDLLSAETPEEKALLYQKADEVRQQYVGDTVYLRGIIEITNYCRRNCNYCGLRYSNDKLPRFRMTPDEIYKSAMQLKDLGLGTIVLQAGEDPHFTVEIVEQLIRRIKSSADVAITLSLGERPRAEYERWKAAGADRYLLKQESSNAELYASLHPDMHYEERLRCLKDLKEIGFQVGGGNMLGLPNQTIADVADDILFLRENDLDMAGIGPFISNPDTPFANASDGNAELAFNAVATARIVLKNTHLPATTALETTEAGGGILALQRGANVIMPNFTPAKYRLLYEIYPNKRKEGDDTVLIFNDIQKKIINIGRSVGLAKGHSLKLSFVTKN